jgi:hypothetical protein
MAMRMAPACPDMPAAIHVRLHVERPEGVRRRERLLDVLDQRRRGK